MERSHEPATPGPEHGLTSLVCGYGQIAPLLSNDVRDLVDAVIFHQLLEDDPELTARFIAGLAESSNPVVRRLAAQDVRRLSFVTEGAMQILTRLIVDDDPKVAEEAYRSEVWRELEELTETISDSVEALKQRFPALSCSGDLKQAMLKMEEQKIVLVEQLRPNWEDLNGLLDFIIEAECFGAGRVFSSENIDTIPDAVRHTIAEVREYMVNNGLIAIEEEV